MQAATTMQDLKNGGMPVKAPEQSTDVEMGFGSKLGFDVMYRAANLLANSTIVPAAYRAVTEIKKYGKVVGTESNPSGIPNAMVALNMANRMGADPLMVMQNLYIIEGRPSWSSQFIIAAINSSGRYTPLRFKLSEPGDPTVIEYETTEWVDGPNDKRIPKTITKTAAVQHRTCVAWAIEKATGERLESPEVSIQMAIDEGWLTKNGSKWQTMPDLMLRYRAAAFFGRFYAPELLMGLRTVEENEDVLEARQEPDGSYAVDINSLKQDVARPANPSSDSAETVDFTETRREQAEPQHAPDPEPESKPESKPATKVDGPTRQDLFRRIANTDDRDEINSAVHDAGHLNETDHNAVKNRAMQRLAELENPQSAMSLD